MDDRERKLRNARRLRRGVVTTGVAGSLGVAGLVGLPALQHATASAPATHQTSDARVVAPRGDDGEHARHHGELEGEHEGEHEGEPDGWAFDDDGGGSSSRLSQPAPQRQWSPPGTGFAPPTTGGSSAPHAGTMGS